MTEKLCVFISYKRQDIAYAERLWEALRAWGYDVWLDVKNIPSGISRETTGWADEIHKALKRCHVLVGCISPESLKSERVREEWFWAKGANRRILLLRLRPFDFEDMPPQFAMANYIDLVENEQGGFAHLQTALQGVHGERDAFKAEITPPAPRPNAPPKVIPPYLLEKQTRRADSDLGRTGRLSEAELMRRRVYQFWVQGVMQTALKEVEALGIPLDMQPEAVVRDTRKNVGDIPLPNDSRHVRQVYDIFKSFLILGDPGAGKTIMLLQLAESLILNPPVTHPDAIPLVLNLSSWVLNPKPIQGWLEDEVWRTYRVPGGRARGWLSNNQVILLLDGLDEVKEEKRAACVEAINAFRASRAFVPLVVCSRIKDYARLGETKLELPGAILLEALSPAQIDHYLSDPALGHLKRVVAEDAVLREMATTPFLLNTMIYAYRHEPEAGLRGFETEAQRRQHLFGAYVGRRLKDNPSPYGYQQTIAYLEWLATKMQAYVQTVFHLEDIQPAWVADSPAFARSMKWLNATRAVQLGMIRLHLWRTKRLPLRSGRFLHVLAERQILRRMGGGYIFIHRYLLENFARVDEVYILIDQLLAEDEQVQQKAAAALVNIGQPAVRPLRERLTNDRLNVVQKEMLWSPLDGIQPRPGVGVRADGLPDIDWVTIPAGPFTFGEGGEAQTIDLPYTYQIAKYPVTVAQFAAFVEAGAQGYRADRYWTANGRQWRGDKTHPELYWYDPKWHIGNRPVVGVTWYEAFAFAAWLNDALTPGPSERGEPDSARAGRGVGGEGGDWVVRLPTEAEWEKAARGTDGRRYPYGNDFDAAKGNTRETGIGRTCAVGLFPNGASPYGALDMSGNVWEWCLTRWASPYQHPGDNAPAGTAGRVFRGGSWDSPQNSARGVSHLPRRSSWARQRRWVSASAAPFLGGAGH